MQLCFLHSFVMLGLCSAFSCDFINSLYCEHQKWLLKKANNLLTAHQLFAGYSVQKKCKGCHLTISGNAQSSLFVRTWPGCQ